MDLLGRMLLLEADSIAWSRLTLIHSTTRGISRDADAVTVGEVPPFPAEDGMMPPILRLVFTLFSGADGI